MARAYSRQKFANCLNKRSNSLLAISAIFSNSNLNDPMLILESLASQMCENVPGFKQKLLDQLRRSHKIQSLKDAFQIYLQNPLDELEEEPRLIVIDGLDESATNDKNDLVKLIADYFPSLPECVKVLMTSRPELSLESLSDIKKTTIDVNVEENDVDLEEYLKDFIAGRSKRHAKRVLRALVKKCEGSFSLCVLHSTGVTKARKS